MDKIFSDQYKNIVIRDRYFLLIDNKENRRFVTINHSQISLAKVKIDLKFFENKHLNTFWVLEEGQNFREISSKDFFGEEMIEGEELDYENANIVNRSNKELYSDGSAQKLSEQEIKKLKEQGVSGEEIIKMVLENNTSMEKRTILSQEKILKKKENRHKYKIWITPITLLNVIETIFQEYPKNINHIRMDSISTILSYSNLTNKANTLIFEECNGLLTNCYAQRSSIHCNIMSLFEERIKAKYNNLLYMKKRDKYPITYMKYEYLINQNTNYYKFFSKYYFNYFENLVLCVNNDQNLLKILTLLFPYVKLCGVIIVFSRELEILVNIEKLLFEKRLALDIRIHETIVREFQVLPLRTHPNMNNKGYSGYVLTGLKINEI